MSNKNCVIVLHSKITMARPKLFPVNTILTRVAIWSFLNVEENSSKFVQVTLTNLQRKFGLCLAFFETAYCQIWPFSFFWTWQPWSWPDKRLLGVQKINYRGGRHHVAGGWQNVPQDDIQMGWLPSHNNTYYPIERNKTMMFFSRI